MLPNDINGGWAYERVSTQLLYPRHAYRDRLNSRSRRTIATDIWTVAIEFQHNIVIRDADDNVVQTLVAVEPNSCDIAFDQNDRYFISWDQSDGYVYIYWYDPTVNEYVTNNIAIGYNSCSSIDDYRPINIPNSDIFLVYQRGNELFYRIQRERFLIEHLVPHVLEEAAVQTCGMGTNLRFTIVAESIDGIILMAGDNPVMVNDFHTGYYWGTELWPKSSSNTATLQDP